MLHLYYTNLISIEEKNNFLDEIALKCRVRPSTVRSWIAKPASNAFRNPKPVYRGILSEITGIKEEKLFKK